MIRIPATIHSKILDAVRTGLSKERKSLPSWLLYDAAGDELFQQIMSLPEYYPTRCEYEILNRYKQEFARYFIDKGDSFNLIELGAGDGTKTQLLLDKLLRIDAAFTYSPVDISHSVLEQLGIELESKHPRMKVEPLHGTYHEAFNLLSDQSRKVVLFFGANIGNMSIAEASVFLSDLTQHLAPRDMMVIGFDLKKAPRIIEAAYDDQRGVTKQFNLNLLERLNATIGAHFDISQFDHYPVYNPESGTASSYLISLKDQDVFIEALNTTVHFAQWETIHTEISQKYDLIEIEKVLSSAGLEIADLFFDQEHYFCDVVAVKA